MAKPIRNTPILMGRDATSFINEADILPSEEERRAERVRLEGSVLKFKALLANLPK